MGIIKKLKDLVSKAPTTSGATKAAEGRSDLADAAGKLDEMRGDNISTGEAADVSSANGPIENAIESVQNSGGLGRVLGDVD